MLLRIFEMLPIIVFFCENHVFTLLFEEFGAIIIEWHRSQLSCIPSLKDYLFRDFERFMDLRDENEYV